MLANHLRRRDSLPDLSEAVKAIRVKNPITQEFAGQHGIYTQANIEKQRSYNLPEWRAVTDEAHHQPPAKRGERRKAAAELPSRARSTRAQAASANGPAPARDGGASARRRAPGRPSRRRQGKKEQADDHDNEDDEDEDDADADADADDASLEHNNKKKKKHKHKHNEDNKHTQS